MRTVVFVAPYATPNTLRYVAALCAIDGIRPAVISADPAEKFPGTLRRSLVAIETVRDCGDARALAEACLAIGRRSGGVDRLFGALEQLQMPIAEARDLARIDGASAEVTRRFRDKSAMKAALRAAGVPCARYVRAESERDVRAFADEVGFPLIVKPVDGLGTRATHRVPDPASLDALLRRMRLGADSPAQVEEFLRGSEHSFETVTIDGRHMWSSSADYIPGPLEVMETPWIQYCVLLPRELSNVGEFAPVNHAALDALGMRSGLSHMEWFRRPDGSVAVNEVGARPPGVNLMPMMSLAHDTDMVAAWVRLMAVDTFDPPARVRAAGSAFLRGQGHGDRIVAVYGLAEVVEALGDTLVELRAPRVGQPRASGYEGEGYAIVAAPTTEAVKRALALLIRNVRVVLGGGD